MSRFYVSCRFQLGDIIKDVYVSCRLQLGDIVQGNCMSPVDYGWEKKLKDLYVSC